MGIPYSAALAARPMLWTEFADALAVRGGQLQYDDSDPTQYALWFYDTPEQFQCVVYVGAVPDQVQSQQGYTQAQNDADLADFEANYLPTANGPNTPKTTGNVAGVAPARGLGGYLPQPTNNPYLPASNELVALAVDGEGVLAVRGPALSDEGSFRDDFPGAALAAALTGTLAFENGSRLVTGTGTAFLDEVDRDHYLKRDADGNGAWGKLARIVSATALELDAPYAGTTGGGGAHGTHWLPETAGGGTIAVSASAARLAVGTTDGALATIWRQGDYGPLALTAWASLDARAADQPAFVGLRDDVAAPTLAADVLFEGADATRVVFRTSNGAEEERTTVTLPNAHTTDELVKYKLIAAADACRLYVQGPGDAAPTLAATHEQHVPGPYDELLAAFGLANAAAQAAGATLLVDTVLVLNYNLLATQTP
jgi:hypothetical protein